jgi:hypothetical protein
VSDGCRECSTVPGAGESVDRVLLAADQARQAVDWADRVLPAADRARRAVDWADLARRAGDWADRAVQAGERSAASGGQGGQAQAQANLPIPQASKLRVVQCGWIPPKIVAKELDCVDRLPAPPQPLIMPQSMPPRWSSKPPKSPSVLVKSHPPQEHQDAMDDAASDRETLYRALHDWEIAPPICA